MKKLSAHVGAKLTFGAFLFCLSVIALTASGQPKIQEVSLRAPAGIKIDGQTLEWPNNKLNAFNYTDNIWYAITNDDNNLYLTVRGPYYPAASKILSSGLTFTISKAIDKKERVSLRDNIAITFPVTERKDAENILMSVGFYSSIRSDTSSKKRVHDSLVNVVNTKTTSALKDIKVIGIKEITDTLISIYNTTGVKAMGSFNRGMAFTVEMAIPLKYLGFSAKDATKFSYNIKLDSEPELIMASTTSTTPVIRKFDSRMSLPADPDTIYMLNPTDFWGEYTLAKQ